MTKEKKKFDKVTVITIAVVVFLVVVFIAGFAWGLNNVLAMEGTMPPSENEASLTAAPASKEEAVEYLNLSVKKALEGKPYFESFSDYEIDEDSLQTNGSDQLKSTLLYLRGDFESYLDDNAAKNTADYFKGFEKYLRVPQISAEDIEKFECDYIYYKCASCGEESDEPHENCEACGNDNPYNEMFRDEYTITLALKNSKKIIDNNFDPIKEKDEITLLGDEAKKVFSVDSLNVEYENPTVTFKVNRLTDEITSLEYSREMNIKSTAEFNGEFAKLEKSEVSFKMLKKDVFNFTWPSLILSDKKKTVEPKNSDNLLATLTCDDPTAYSVKWASSDPELLSVDEEGYYKAGKEAGEATITASFEFGGKTYSDSCKILVRHSVESIRVSDRKLNINQGETYKLTVDVSPKKATVKTVKWFSEDESIATVDENGTVTAVSKGTVNVYALSDDEYYKSTCEVRVK